MKRGLPGLRLLAAAGMGMLCMIPVLQQLLAALLFSLGMPHRYGPAGAFHLVGYLLWEGLTLLLAVLCFRDVAVTLRRLRAGQEFGGR